MSVDGRGEVLRLDGCRRRARSRPDGYRLQAGRRRLLARAHEERVPDGRRQPGRLGAVGPGAARRLVEERADQLVLLGTLANEHRDERWLFGVGAVTASAVWFVSLGLGARQLAGLFAKPLTWRILDGLIAAMMLALGMSLALS